MMSPLFHVTVIAATVAATAAVGASSVSYFSTTTSHKADRLPIAVACDAAALGCASPAMFRVVESRTGNVSTLTRVPAGL